MSLFQRSNDSQKFLVTLNGYNNNVSKEKGVSDEDERLEMEVTIKSELLRIYNKKWLITGYIYSLCNNKTS